MKARRILTFSVRTARDILRDPLNLAFGLGFPLILLLLLSAIQANIPVALFVIERLAPGLAVFGLSFITLFSASLIAKDRASSLARRLYTTPMRPADFILGYTLPLLPISLLQGAVCFLAAIPLGLTPSPRILIALASLLPVALLFIALGLLFGSFLTDRQVGGICGALLTNLTAWLSGIWFDLELVGGAFKAIAEMLPFSHAVKLVEAALNGGAALPHLLWVAAYAAGITALAVLLFLRQMKRQ
jgi:ABC-2 type transport system permease protein